MRFARNCLPGIPAEADAPALRSVPLGLVALTAIVFGYMSLLVTLGVELAWVGGSAAAGGGVVACITGRRLRSAAR